MVEETIREIRETEKKADEIVRSAEEESRKIIEEAGQKAGILKDEILSKARENALKVAEDAEKKPEKRTRGRLTMRYGSLKRLPLREKRRQLGL